MNAKTPRRQDQREDRIATRGRIVIAGGSGFIGRALARHLAARGDEVVILTRSPRPIHGTIREVRWDGQVVEDAWLREIDAARAVINLAGKNVNCRYTRRNLAEIDESRVNAVRAMAEAINRCANPPPVLVQASTTAIYGDAGEHWCDESAPLGDGVAVATATKWENAFASIATPRTRRVLLRISFVLGRGGGVLRMLAAMTRCFLGGTVGSGQQYISWVHIDDLCRVVARAIDDASMNGLYNVATSNPVTNAQFMRELRRACHRPWSPPVPAWAVRLGCFILRTEPILALTGRRVESRRLREAGFSFEHEDPPRVLTSLLQRHP
jgi:uncharacterized protein (TIGR01777 family)